MLALLPLNSCSPLLFCISKFPECNVTDELGRELSLRLELRGVLTVQWCKSREMKKREFRDTID